MPPHIIFIFILGLGITLLGFRRCCVKTLPSYMLCSSRGGMTDYCEVSRIKYEFASSWERILMVLEGIFHRTYEKGFLGNVYVLSTELICTLENGLIYWVFTKKYFRSEGYPPSPSFITLYIYVSLRGLNRLQVYYKTTKYCLECKSVPSLKVGKLVQNIYRVIF